MPNKPKMWKIETVALDTIKELPKNGRYISPKNLTGLRKSLEKFGVVELPVFNRKTGHLISGHQRLSVLKEKLVKEAPMIVVEMSEEEELSAALTVNNPEVMGSWTPAVLDILQLVETNTSDVYKDLNFDALRNSLKEFDTPIPPNPESGSTDFKMPEPTKPGDTKCPCCSHVWSITASDVSVDER